MIICTLYNLVGGNKLFFLAVDNLLGDGTELDSLYIKQIILNIIHYRHS